LEEYNTLQQELKSNSKSIASKKDELIINYYIKELTEEIQNYGKIS